MNQTGEITVQPRAEQAAALLVIDVQQGLFRKSTPIFRSELLLDTITTLVGRARAAGVLVVYVRHASGKVLPFGSADWQHQPRLHPGKGDLIVHT
jgi:nicotinamidase-related amidase